MRNCFKILILLMYIALTTACKFPDTNLDWQKIKDYKLDRMSFGITKVGEFKQLVPDANSENVSKYIEIFTVEPANLDIYKKIRVGFRNNRLDWIEFVLKNDVPMSKIIELYGKPSNINTKYSPLFDYFDYGFFNISTDKKHALAKCVNIFEIPIKPAVKAQPVVINNIPDWKELALLDFMGLKPGYTIEADFNDRYSHLKAHRANKFDTASKYILDGELGKAKAYYKKVTISFNYGLLNWIDITPQNLPLANAVKLFGSKYKIESASSKYSYYDYDKFVLIVDKKNKKVVSIGIVSTKE